MSRYTLEPRSIAGRTSSPALSQTNLLAHAAGTVIVIRDLSASTSVNCLSQRLLHVPKHQSQIAESSSSHARGSVSPERSNSMTLNFEEFAEPAKGRERTKSLVSLDISPDGRYVIAGEAGQAPRILLWDLSSSSQEPIQIICVHTHGVQLLKFAPDSRRFVSIGYMHDGNIHVFATNNAGSAFQKVATNRITSRLNSVSWIGDRIITLGTRHIKVWHCEAGKGRRKSLESLDRPTPQLEGRNAILGQFVQETFIDLVQLHDVTCAIACGETSVCLLDLDERQVRPLLEGRSKIKCLYSDSGTLLGAGDFGALEVLQRGGSLANQLLQFQSSAVVESILGTDHCTIVATKDGKLRVYFRQEDPIILAGSTPVIHYAERDDESITVDKKAVVTHIRETGILQTQLGCASSVTSASAWDRLVVLGHATGSVSLCNLETELSVKLRAHQDEVANVCMLRTECDIVLLASASKDQTVQLFQASSPDGQVPPTLNLLQTCDDHTAAVTQLLLLPDMLVSGASDRTIILRHFALNDGEIVWKSRRTVSLKSAPTCWAIQEPGILLVATTDKSMLRVDPVTAVSKELYKTDEAIARMAISGDNLCCSHLSDRSLAIRSLETGCCISNRGFVHTERLTSLMWSKRDPTICVSTSTDGLTVHWRFQERIGAEDDDVPVRKPIGKAELLKLSSPRQQALTRPARRKAETPRQSKSPSRPLSPSKLGEGRHSPSPSSVPISAANKRLRSPARPSSRSTFTTSASSDSLTATDTTQERLLERTLSALESLSASHVRIPLDDAALAQLRRASSWFSGQEKQVLAMDVNELMNVMKQRLADKNEAASEV